MLSLKDKAMTAELNVSRWTARKHDRNVSREVAQAHGAGSDDSSIGRYNKILVAREALRGLEKNAAAARQCHYSLTLPWNDRGPRLLPASLYFEYMAAMQEYQDRDRALVDSFVSEYPVLVHDARARLNGLFCADDYPDVSQIGGKFSFAVDIMPIADASDFRLELGAENIARVQSEIEAQLTAKFAGACADAWNRIYEAVEHIRDRMRAYNPEGGKLHESVIGNLRDLCAILPALNIADDPELERMRDRLQSELCGFEVKALRENSADRLAAHDAASALLSALGSRAGS